MTRSGKAVFNLFRFLFFFFWLGWDSLVCFKVCQIITPLVGAVIKGETKETRDQSLCDFPSNTVAEDRKQSQAHRREGLRPGESLFMLQTTSFRECSSWQHNEPTSKREDVLLVMFLKSFISARVLTALEWPRLFLFIEKEEMPKQGWSIVLVF